jgi:hypothetical protein
MYAEEGTPMQRNIRRLALELGLVTAIVLTLGYPGRAWARCGDCILQTTKLLIPIEGEVTAGTDQVMLTGQLHILTQVEISPSATTIYLDVNLSDVRGEGVPSGAMYEGTGAVQMQFTPPSPMLPDPLRLTFSLDRGTPSNAIFPLFVELHTSFAADGTLTEAEVVSLASCGGEVCGGTD